MAKRRGAGEGSIYKRADDRWAGTLTVGRDANGMRRRVTVYAATQAEVVEKLQDLQAQCREGRIPENPSRLLLSEYLDHWLANVVTLERSDGTARIYKRAADYVRPFIGGVRLLELRRAHVEDLFVQLRRLPRIEVIERVLNVKGVEGREEKLKRLAKARRAAEPLDGGTLATVRTALGSALDRARKAGLIAINPVRDASAVRSAPKRRKFLDATELDRFLREAARDRYATFWALAVQSGARLGELLGLRWGCVDFRRGVIRIERQWRPETRKLADPKSRHAVREVTLSGAAMEALRVHRAALGAVPHPESLVFATATGRPPHPSTLTRNHLKPILRRAGLPPETRIHDLRHGSASVLADAGTPLNVLKERLGHHSLRVTEIYLHSSPEAQRKAAETIDAVLSVPRQTAS
jgi:integrase